MFLQKPMLGTQLDRSDSLNNPVLDLLMNEGHGDKVYDLSGYGNHGTLHGFDFPPTRTSGWNPGRDGVALTFDGSDDYISIPYSDSLNITGDLTIDLSFYFKTDWGVGDRWMSLVDKAWGDDPRGSYSLFFRGSTGDLRLSRSSKTIVSAKTSWSAGWYRLIATSNAYATILYINGVLDASTVGGSDTGNLNDVNIGRSINNTHYTIGSIARVRILSRAMSSLEVMQTQIDPYGVYLR